MPLRSISRSASRHCQAQLGELPVGDHAVAVNSLDGLKQTVGFFVEEWPSVMGLDLAGEVVGLGDGVKNPTPGTGIIAHARSRMIGKPENGSFQKYTVVQVAASSPIPNRLFFEKAAAVPLACSTAAGELFQERYLALPLPSTSRKKVGTSILVWSASSSVGSAAT